jgi:ribosomal-protein-alanine N-acetyltransferase
MRAVIRRGAKTRMAEANGGSAPLFGRQVMLRELVLGDFDAWREVRTASADWLVKWEPQRNLSVPDPTTDRDAFAIRCSSRQRERQLGTGYGFGIFVDGEFVGEINLSSVQRGAFQSGYVGYWIGESAAGNGFVPEALVVLARYAFEELFLHRLQISIIPRNAPSRRVMEKLDLRSEGVAARYLEINGVWEDHVRYAITAEEWDLRRDQLEAAWL